jgi:hypothetical protein
VEFLPDCGHAVPTDAPWGTTRVSPSTVSNLNKKIHGQIEAWRNQPIEGELDADRAVADLRIDVRRWDNRGAWRCLIGVNPFEAHMAPKAPPAARSDQVLNKS